jgi:hypothetical protein
VRINIAQAPVQKARTFQKNVRFVLATIQQITEVAHFLTTFKIAEITIPRKQIIIISTITPGTTKIMHNGSVPSSNYLGKSKEHHF